MVGANSVFGGIAAGLVGVVEADDGGPEEGAPGEARARARCGGSTAEPGVTAVGTVGG